MTASTPIYVAVARADAHHRPQSRPAEAADHRPGRRYPHSLTDLQGAAVGLSLSPSSAENGVGVQPPRPQAPLPSRLSFLSLDTRDNACTPGSAHLSRGSRERPSYGVARGTSMV